ncbi:MAG: microcin C ABC transporter permease YejB, partial [Pseudomonadota bacterium]
MAAYLLKRILLIFPTMVGIMLISFIIIQFAPGGPVERVIAQLQGTDVSLTSRISGGGGDGLGSGGGQSGQAAGDGGGAASSQYRGAQGLDPEFIKSLEKQFGFDKPAHERFLLMMGNYLTFNFGQSYFRDVAVIDLIAEKLPVSISLGLWMTLLTYLISIPLGIRKAVTDGERFDVWTSGFLVIGYAVPGFLVAVLLLVVFAGSSFFQWFPSRGLTSEEFQSYTMMQCTLSLRCVGDYFWHLTLPLIALALGAFTTMAFLTKNSFLDEIRKQYVLTARAKGLNENQVLYGHIFRNAMLLIIAGFPALFIGVFFGASLIIETIFSLDGLGRLGFEAAVARDYPVIFGTLFVFGL